jgi:hypothetical protein
MLFINIYIAFCRVLLPEGDSLLSLDGRDTEVACAWWTTSFALCVMCAGTNLARENKGTCKKSGTGFLTSSTSLPKKHKHFFLELSKRILTGVLIFNSDYRE